MKDLIDAYPTSKKHLIGFGVSFVLCVLFGIFNLMGWNELYYIDEIFGYEIKIKPFLGQSLLVIFMGFFANWCFEYFQQRNLKEKPSRKDTVSDTLYFMISSYLGYLAIQLIALIFY
jgi:hypothetical protein